MRPERLTLKGFGVFRDYTEIDFSGIELFALTGSTGSGKTTVLDGICFALYGSVPRHGRGAVAPIVTQGLLEATVALSFSLGEDLFSVARRIKRNPRGKGAVTTEASLERGVEVLATGGQVTDRVTELLGLDFDQFTTCVLLPQGEFARFLHDKPADRQDLLAALLDLGIYDRIAQLALNRQRLADDRLRMIDQRLERIGAVTADDLTEVRSAEDALVRLLEWLEDTTPELAALDSEARELTLESDRCRMMLATVRALESPSDLQEVGDHVATLEAEAAEARLSLDAARARQGEVLDQGTSLPAGSQIKTWIEARRNLDASSRELEPARKAVVESLATLTEAGNAVVAAREVERAAADGDRAAHLRRGLEVGDACPVCGQPIHEVPPLHESAETVLAERHLAECERAEQVARKVHADAENQLHRLEARIADLSRQLETVPDLSGLEVLQRQVDEYEASLASTQTEVESASSRLERIERQRRKISEREAAIRSGLQSSWSRAVQSGLEPPPFDLDDPFRSWRELGEWRVATEPRLIEAAEKASTRLEEVGRRRGLVVEAIDKRLGDHNIERGSLPPRDAVVDSISGARTRREKLEEALEELAARIVEKETVSQDQRLARQLGLE
ncbi:MAG: AAA family ATPase, partial [Acidimicrobiia bacterium]